MNIWILMRNNCKKRHGLPIFSTFMITNLFHCQVTVVGNLNEKYNSVQIGRWTSPHGHPKWETSKANYGKELRIK